ALGGEAKPGQACCAGRSTGGTKASGRDDGGSAAGGADFSQAGAAAAAAPDENDATRSGFSQAGAGAAAAPDEADATGAARGGSVTPRNLPWVSIYWIFTVCTVVMVAVSWLSHFPKYKRTEEEQAGTLDMYRKLLR